MRYRNLVFPFLALSLLGCNDSKNGDTPRTDAVTDSLEDSISKVIDTVSKESFSDDTVFHVIFSDSGEGELKARLSKKGPAIVVHFAIKKKSTLTAMIVPVKTDCNLRINSIVLPGNKSDGPFGRELNYKLTRKGDYQLVIGPNLMAGDVESCNFVLKLKLE